MVVVPINKYKVAAQQVCVENPATILKRIFIFNTLLMQGMHDSWRPVILKKLPVDALRVQSVAMSRQLEKILKMPEDKTFDYPDPLQWLVILDDEDFQRFMLNLGAFCCASTIKCAVLKQQVADLKILLGEGLYEAVLKNEFSAIGKIHHSLFSETGSKGGGGQAQLTSLAPFYQAACQVLAVVFIDQTLFFKKRLALRLPYDAAQLFFQPMAAPVLSAEKLVNLRQVLFHLLDKVSAQWQKWLA